MLEHLADGTVGVGFGRDVALYAESGGIFGCLCCGDVETGDFRSLLEEQRDNCDLRQLSTLADCWVDFSRHNILQTPVAETEKTMVYTKGGYRYIPNFLRGALC